MKIFHKTNKVQMYILISSVLIVAGIVSGCKKADNTTTPAPTSPGTNEVWMQNNTFNPGTITMAINTTIKWTNKDGVIHTVTSNSAAFESGNIVSNGTFSHQFTTAGSYPYHCTVHSSMTGTVIVQ